MFIDIRDRFTKERGMSKHEKEADYIVTPVMCVGLLSVGCSSNNNLKNEEKKEEIQAQLQMYENDFEGLMDRLADMKKAYSEENEWIEIQNR